MPSTSRTRHRAPRLARRDAAPVPRTAGRPSRCRDFAPPPRSTPGDRFRARPAPGGPAGLAEGKDRCAAAAIRRSSTKPRTAPALCVLVRMSRSCWLLVHEAARDGAVELESYRVRSRRAVLGGHAAQSRGGRRSCRGEGREDCPLRRRGPLRQIDAPTRGRARVLIARRPLAAGADVQREMELTRRSSFLHLAQRPTSPRRAAPTTGRAIPRSVLHPARLGPLVAKARRSGHRREFIVTRRPWPATAAYLHSARPHVARGLGTRTTRLV